MQRGIRNSGARLKQKKPKSLISALGIRPFESLVKQNQSPEGARRPAAKYL